MATLMFIAANHACEGPLVVADRRMRTIALPITIASHEARFHASIDTIGVCPVAIHTGTAAAVIVKKARTSAMAATISLLPATNATILLPNNDAMTCPMAIP